MWLFKFVFFFYVKKKGSFSKGIGLLANLFSGVLVIGYNVIFESKVVDKSLRSIEALIAYGIVFISVYVLLVIIFNGKRINSLIENYHPSESSMRWILVL